MPPPHLSVRALGGDAPVDLWIVRAPNDVPSVKDALPPPPAAPPPGRLVVGRPRGSTTPPQSTPCFYHQNCPPHTVVHATGDTTPPAATVRPVKPELTDLLHVFNSPPGVLGMPLVGLTPSPLGALAVPPSLQDDDLWGKLDAPLGAGDAGALGYGPSAMFD